MPDVMTQEKKHKGRPPRESLEVARTALWYERVRKVSGWTEYRLEAAFDKVDRLGRGMHKGSRWNKYKFGRASPRRPLLLGVEEKFAGTLLAYDHPIWTLAASRTLNSQELRGLVGLLPPEIAGLLIDPASPPNSAFWVRNELEHRELIASMLAMVRARGIGHFGAVAGLLALRHDAVNRQLEEQHFDCHVALADAAARAYGHLDDEVYAWRLESYVFSRWLDTNYRDKRMREVVEAMRGLETGPSAPWMPRQGGLALGRPNAHRSSAALQDMRGFWVGQKLAGMASQMGLAGGR
jgi:hypothetical protein